MPEEAEGTETMSVVLRLDGEPTMEDPHIVAAPMTALINYRAAMHCCVVCGSDLYDQSCLAHRECRGDGWTVRSHCLDCEKHWPSLMGASNEVGVRVLSSSERLAQEVRRRFPDAG